MSGRVQLPHTAQYRTQSQFQTASEKRGSGDFQPIFSDFVEFIVKCSCQVCVKVAKAPPHSSAPSLLVLQLKWFFYNVIGSWTKAINFTKPEESGDYHLTLSSQVK